MAANNTRNVFFRMISELMSKDNNIYIVSVDLAGPPFDEIRNTYPDRYIPVGIAEQNSIAVSCGLASLGKKVIVYAANPFPLFRAFDQIRNCACTMNLPIIIVGLGTGFSVSECGTTHLTIEDIALSSLCSGLDIFSVSDIDVARKLAESIYLFNRPTYIRFGKWSDEPLSNYADIDFCKGYREIAKGNKVAIISTGCTVKLIKEMNLPDDVSLIDWFKLSSTTCLIEKLKNFETIITVEEHQLRGGLGSIILERFNDLGINKIIKRIGIDLLDSYPQEYGNREYWLDKFMISKQHILDLLK